MGTVRLLATWIDALPLQQQAVLVMATRGPDGFPKHHASKPLLYYYRACVMAAADKGRHLRMGEHIASLMTLRGFDTSHAAPGTWTTAVTQFESVEDALPVHYFTHLMHGAEVIAYKHPSLMVQHRWFEFYDHCCKFLHVPVETIHQMNARLSDFGRDWVNGEVID